MLAKTYPYRIIPFVFCCLPVGLRPFKIVTPPFFRIEYTPADDVRKQIKATKRTVYRLSMSLRLNVRQSKKAATQRQDKGKRTLVLKRYVTAFRWKVKKDA